MDEQVLWVTGGSSGIGAAIARRAAAHGHRAFVTGRDGARLRRFLTEAGDQEHLDGQVSDTSDWEATRAAATAAVERFGRLDAVVANAGFSTPGDFAGGDPGQWRDMVLTNVYGVALTVRASLPHLLETKGSVMLIGSVAGTRIVPGSLYGATKAAVHAMGENLRAQLVGTDVRVSVIQPGRVATPFWETAPDVALDADDVAAAALWVLHQPDGVDVNEVRVRPTGQER